MVIGGEVTVVEVTAEEATLEATEGTGVTLVMVVGGTVGIVHIGVGLRSDTQSAVAGIENWGARSALPCTRRRKYHG